MTDASTSRAHRPGDWLGVFGARTILLLPGTARDRVATAWQLVDDDTGVEEILDELLRDGLRALPDFAVLAVAGDRARVVVRGAARASLTTAEGTLEVTAGDEATWAERSATGVTGWRLQAGEPTGEPAPLPPSAVLLRVAEAWAPAAAAPGGPDTPAAASRPGAAGPRYGEPASGPPPPVGPPSGPPPPVTGAGDQRTEHDGLTVAGGAAVPGTGRQPVARLVFSHGDEVVVDRVVLVGRAPEARPTSGAQPRLVTVPSPAHEISSTHLEIRPGTGADLDSAVATDLGSTNGTVVVQPGLPPEELRPGIAVQLIPGAILDLGDGLTIQVVNP